MKYLINLKNWFLHWKENKMTDTNQNQTALAAHHVDFLASLQSLTTALGPILSAVVPGAAPFVAGAAALEKIAAAVQESASQVVTNAQIVVDNTPATHAPIVDDSALIAPASPVSDPAPVQTATIVPAPAVSLDPASLAAQSISQANLLSDPVALAQTVIKLQADLEALMHDVEPIISMFESDWSAVKGILKQFGK